MNHRHWNRVLLAGVMFLCLLTGGCGDSAPWRYNPGIPAKPAALAAMTGNGQVSLSWTESPGAAGYTVYYGASPGVTIATAAKVLEINSASTSTIVTGLTNDVTYYFAITADSINGKSPLSDQVAIAPSPPGAFKQSDLLGAWRFNVLVSGAGAGWMRGTAAIDGAGNISILTFLDNSGNSSAPTGLFTAMTILPDGTVFQAGTATGFHGELSANQFKDTLVGTATTAASRQIMILQKQVDGIVFSSSDIKGTGKQGAGPLTFVYHQLSSGTNQEWEYAGGQVGQDQAVTYSSISAPTSRQLPGTGSKVASLAITPDGIVTETANGVLPQPAAVMSHGVMSADKMTVVGAMTDASGAFVLRVMQMIHPPSIALTSSDYALTSLAGSYSLHTLTSGTAPLWAYGTLGVDTTGSVSFSSYLNSNAGLTPPAAFMLAMDQQGTLTKAVDTSYNGRLSYFGDMIVSTRTDAAGGSALDIALKR